MNKIAPTLLGWERMFSGLRSYSGCGYSDSAGSAADSDSDSGSAGSAADSLCDSDYS